MSRERNQYGRVGQRSYIVKRREIETWLTWVHRGDIAHQRRVKRWSKWKTLQYMHTAVDAETVFDRARKQFGGGDVAVFHKGKRLTVEQLRAHANAERNGIESP